MYSKTPAKKTSHSTQRTPRKSENQSKPESRSEFRKNATPRTPKKTNAPADPDFPKKKRTNTNSKDFTRTSDKKRSETGGFKPNYEKKFEKRTSDKKRTETGDFKPNYEKKFEKRTSDRPVRSFSKTRKKSEEKEGIRLNKYIANAGICSRREADTLIATGVVRINGEICTQLGTRVMSGDKVEFGGETLSSQKKVYLLMNKPKDYITTTDDPQERKTVMELIKDACRERIYPVGRLDRQTTGVLLFTNDGEMAKRLTHPSHGARKIYHVRLDKNITKNDLRSIAEGVELEDGFVHVDEINLIAETKNEVGIQLHSGKNRVVRRIFDKFGYKVVKLDRVLFAELTKKDLSRGHYRMLTDKEIAFLKMK